MNEQQSTQTNTTLAGLYADASPIGQAPDPQAQAQATPAPRPKLSALIKKGAQITGKLTNSFFRVQDGEQYTCALGAAYVGLHGPKWAFTNRESAYHRPSESVSMALSLATGCDLFDLEVPLPPGVDPAAFNAEDTGAANIFHVVTALNDKFGWSREAIADYLEGLGF